MKHKYGANRLVLMVIISTITLPQFPMVIALTTVQEPYSGHGHPDTISSKCE